jgi:hypothetical protein
MSVKEAQFIYREEEEEGGGEKKLILCNPRSYS